MSASIHPLRRIRFELGDISQPDFGGLLGVSFMVIAKCEQRKKFGWKLVQSLSSKLDISLDLASAICSGEVSDDDLKLITEKAKDAFLAKSKRGVA